MTLAAGTQVGRYVVQQKLAEGGMAEIYLCAAQGPEGFEKEVVIKRVRPFLASDPGFVQMFIAEARVASRLNHANVVQIFDFDKHEDTYYLAMELVRGASLWELRRRCKEQLSPVPPVLVAHIGLEVARGLHYAHRLRGADGEPLHLVHRDVTPQNILLSFDGAVKLTDFGIAKAGKSFTAPGMLKGKFAYMSPEQARGEEVDARTDVFALGVVLWEMLTGGRLFEGDSEVAVLRAVQQGTIVPPARLNPDVPLELDAVVRKALERDPAARYQSAFELERALGEVTLRHAKSVDDTDVGAFVRRLYGIGFTTLVRTVPAPGEGTPVSAPREPTAVMPGVGSRSQGGSGVARDVLPDEDINASTHVLEPGRRESPPTEPLPAVGSAPRTPARATPSVPPPPAASEASVPTASVAPRGQGGAPAAAPRRAGWVVGLASVGLVAAVGAVALLRPGKEPAPAEAPAVVRPATPAPSPVAEAPVAEAPTPAPVAVAAPDAGTVPVAPPAPPVVEAVKAKGQLVVRAIPFATVLLDGKRLGEVQGRATYPLAPGQYKLTFVHPSHTKSYSITIESNGSVQREFRASAPH